MSANTDDLFRAEVERFLHRWFLQLHGEHDSGRIAKYMAFQNVMTFFVEWSLPRPDDEKQTYEELIVSEMASADGARIH